jgi:hypothetical protein
MVTQNSITHGNHRAAGCFPTFVLIGAALWVLALTGVAQFTTWIVDEAQYQGAPVDALLSKVIIQSSYGIGLLILLWPLARSEKRLFHFAYRTWKIAALFPLAYLPLGFLELNDTQLAAVMQIIGSVIILVLLMRWSRAGLGRRIEGGIGENWITALLVIGILAIPWAAWGALGSILDTLLQLGAGLSFGLAATMALDISLFDYQESNTRGGVFLTGGVIAVALLIMVTGMGYAGLKWVLGLVLPGLGWAVAGLFILQTDAGKRRDWISTGLLIGLATALPKIFLDVDELALPFGIGEGGLIQWTLRAAIVSLGLSLLAGIVVWNSQSRRVNPGAFTPQIGGGIFIWGLVGLVYLFQGQPGFYGDRLFVILKEQGDLAQAAAIDELSQRRGYVYSTLASHAEQSQADLRADLDRFGFRYTPYYLVNALEVRGGPFVRLWLNSRQEVDRVLDSPTMRPLPSSLPAARGTQAAPQATPWNITMVGAERVWEEFGVTGEGIVIGHSDSGVQGDHPDLAQTYRGQNNRDDYNWFDPWYHTSSPTDTSGHGTHTLGSMVGINTGVAPGANWFACANLARGMGNPALYLDCMQFMLAPFPNGGDPFRDGDPSKAADVINNSWGCPKFEGCDPQALERGVEALRAAGIFVVASAGNSGMFGCSTVQDPIAIYESTFAVGAVDSQGQLAMFSSLGPVLVDGSRRMKPDIVAPGVGILSAFPGSTYSTVSGTSMAGPHVAGVVALIWSANPDLIGEIEETEEILIRSAAPFRGLLPDCVEDNGVPNNAVGWGVVDAYAAVQLAMDR